MTAAIPAGAMTPAPTRFDARWKRHAAILAGAWIALLLLFRRDTGDLATIYWTNTTFGHCLFVVLVQ